VDAGQQWLTLPDLPVSSSFGTCSLQTDENDPLTVLVALTQSQTSGDLSFVLTDGTPTWQPASNGIELLASWHQVAYVMKVNGISGRLELTDLYVSTDLNRSWHQIDGPILKSAGAEVTSYRPQQLWVQPKTGALLVWTLGGLLWTSSDQGAHWHQI